MSFSRRMKSLCCSHQGTGQTGHLASVTLSQVDMLTVVLQHCNASQSAVRTCLVE